MKRFHARALLLTVVGTMVCAGLLEAAGPDSESLPEPYVAVLVAKKMCCGKESKPAVAELSKLRGVGKITVNHKAKTLSIEATEVMPSAREIWEVAERVKIVPVELTMAEGVYRSRPKR